MYVLNIKCNNEGCGIKFSFKHLFKKLRTWASAISVRGGGRGGGTSPLTLEKFSKISPTRAKLWVNNGFVSGIIDVFILYAYGS